MTYQQQLKDPRWQKKRLQVLERDNWTCQWCGETTKTLHVHHEVYIEGDEPWDAWIGILSTLCEDCHRTVHLAKTPLEKFLMMHMIMHCAPRKEMKWLNEAALMAAAGKFEDNG